MQRPKKVVTTTMVARMKEMRAAGASYMAIAVETGLSLTSVMRHVSEHHEAKQREYQRKRDARDKQERARRNDNNFSKDNPPES